MIHLFEFVFILVSIVFMGFQVACVNLFVVLEAVSKNKTRQQEETLPRTRKQTKKQKRKRAKAVVCECACVRTVARRACARGPGSNCAFFRCCRRAQHFSALVHLLSGLLPAMLASLRFGFGIGIGTGTQIQIQIKMKAEETDKACDLKGPTFEI